VLLIGYRYREKETRAEKLSTASVRRGREIPFEPEDPSRDNVESPRLAKGKES
jgi:hypothetical protein